MAVTSNRRVIINFTERIPASIAFDAEVNIDSPGVIEIFTLDAGDNTIVKPTGDTNVASATIIPPLDNLETITLKGDVADVGIALHLTDPTSIALGEDVAEFVLEVSGEIGGLRIIWA